MIQESILRLPEYSSQLLRKLVILVFVFVVLIPVLFLAGCGGLVSHKVEPGDSLYSIGFYYGHDYRDIAKWNNIPSPYVIHKGEWLRVAPPDEKWWAEQEQRRKEQKQQSASDKRSGNKMAQRKSWESSGRNGRQGIEKESSKKVVTQDFTDKSGKISAWVWPTKGRLLNADKKFSQRNKGIDIAGKRGQLVFTAAAGKVVYSGSGLIGYGKLIIVKHNKTYLSAYAHNERILVKEGEIVKRGQKIAHMGRTPDNHIQLHFEIRRNGKPVDPLHFLKR